MRADRLISILLWLQVRGQTTTSELANRLEVSERTILRDMDALTTAGIPIRAVRGRQGGWVLPVEYRTSPRWLSAGEIGALAVLSPATTLEALGIDNDARSAWLKLQAALPPAQRDLATQMRERIHVDSSSWKQSTERLDWLGLLYHALREERMVWLRYTRADGTTSDRVVSPLGLVARVSTWYLVAAVDDDIRTYRVSRISEATMRPESAERPPGFDLAAHWESSKVAMQERVPSFPVTLRVLAPAVADLRARANWARIEQVAIPDAHGWVLVEIMFELEHDALAAVLGLGERCEVVSPPELRRSVAFQIRRALDLYPERSDTTMQ
jgi:predicted DNA-binding transcriptional regulator YafY